MADENMQVPEETGMGLLAQDRDAATTDDQQVQREANRQSTPEELDANDKAMSRANDLIYGNDETNKQVIQMLQSGGDIADIVADATVFITGLVDREQNIPETMILPVALGSEVADGETEEAEGIVDLVIDLAEEITGEAFSPERSEKAHILAVSKLADEYGATEEDFFNMMSEQGTTKEQFGEALSSFNTLEA